MEEGSNVGNPIEEAKGRVKEAVGALTDDRSMKREGEAQQKKEENKQEATEALERAQDAEEEERKAQRAG
jgi:uncharacterized protein YjbJ (UPF0337 family)